MCAQHHAQHLGDGRGIYLAGPEVYEMIATFFYAVRLQKHRHVVAFKTPIKNNKARSVPKETYLAQNPYPISHIMSAIELPT